VNYNITEVKKDLEDLGYFKDSQNPFVVQLANCLPDSVPYKMRLAVAVSETVTFASMFRCNIEVGLSKIPTNAITFILSNSGTSKDRTVRAIRNCFKTGYKAIDDFRNLSERNRCLRACNKGKLPDPEDIEGIESSKEYQKIYRKPPEIFCALSTHEGFIYHLNQIEDSELGAGCIYSGEIGAEIRSNNLTEELFKLLAEIYDTGYKELKIIKDVANRNRTIQNLAVSALFVSDPNLILYDASIRNKFKNEFVSKLSRRVFFCYNSEARSIDSFTTKEEYLSKILSDSGTQDKLIMELQDTFKQVANKNIATLIKKPLKMSAEMKEDFYLYLRYCELEAESLNPQLYKLAKLSIEHARWRALKLSGAFAIMDNSQVIQRKHFIQAVAYCELLKPDTIAFEDEMNKFPFEYFYDYMVAMERENKSRTRIIDAKKLGFIDYTDDKSLNTFLAEVNDVNSDTIFIIDNREILMTRTDINRTFMVSGKRTEGVKKEDRYAHVANGLKYHDAGTFSKLSFLLSSDIAYSPFKFDKGIRRNDNITSQTAWICLDIDNNANLSVHEAHEQMSIYNHHIALTSDVSNLYSYRILLELDRDIDIPPEKWRKFMELIDRDLNLGFDKLAKAQAYFGYKGRQVYSTLDAEPYKVKEALVTLNSTTTEKVKPLSAAEKKNISSNLHSVFHYAFTEKANPGKKRVLYKVLRHAMDLGLNETETRSLLKQIVDYWGEPLDTNWENNFSKQISYLYKEQNDS
jgi:hypothetical protein